MVGFSGTWSNERSMPKIRRTSQRLASQRSKKSVRGTTNESERSMHIQSTSADSANSVCTPVEMSTTGEGPNTNGSSNLSLTLVQEFRRLCKQAASEHQELCAKDAEQMKKYMRNKFEFFGLKSPQRRRLQKEFLDNNSEILKERDVLFALLGQLWEQEEREFQAFGVDFCRQFRKEMLGRTDDHFREAVLKVQACVTCKSWWDTVDALSYPVIGYFVKERPALGVPLMDQWISHDNMWLRRVAILHQLNLKTDTDQARLFSMCLSRAHEQEFFIRKAIGWALREYSKSNKIAVREFVEKNRESLSGLSIREAMKYC